MTEVHTPSRLQEELARSQPGDLNFPTCMDAAVLIRDTLRQPAVSIERVAQVVHLDPLISSKLLRLANTVIYNPVGQPVTDVGNAVQRLGFEVVRITSLAVAMEQLLKSRRLEDLGELAHNAWRHSVEVAAIARALARHQGDIDPEKAMLAGLVHDIGVFYLLHVAADYPEYHNNPAGILELLANWHEEIGEKIVRALGLPQDVLAAVHAHDHIQGVGEPHDLRDVLHLANLLAGDDKEWTPELAAAGAQEIDRERYRPLLEEAEHSISDLHVALAP